MDYIKNDKYPEGKIPVSVLKNFKDYGRPDLRDLSENFFLIRPPVVNAGHDVNSANQILQNCLGLSDVNRFLIVNTPVGQVKIFNNQTEHVIKKRLDARERYSNFIIPTLKNPFEIYSSIFDGDLTAQFIGLYKAGLNIMVATTVVVGKPMIFRNMMPAYNKTINRHRRGDLIFVKRYDNQV